MGKLLKCIVCVMLVMGGAVACSKGNAGCVKIGNVTKLEGNPDPATGATDQEWQVVVTFTGCPSAGKLIYETVEGNAKAIKDFKHLASAVVFQSGNSTKNITVTVVRDRVEESDKYFYLVACLDPEPILPSGAAHALVASGVITISDDDGSDIRGVPSARVTTPSSAPDGYGCGRKTGA
jgi:hypothetical protein